MCNIIDTFMNGHVYDFQSIEYSEMNFNFWLYQLNREMNTCCTMFSAHTVSLIL